MVPFPLEAMPIRIGRRKYNFKARCALRKTRAASARACYEARHASSSCPGIARPKDGVASARLCPWHPRLCRNETRKTWMAGTSPAMTEKCEGCAFHIGRQIALGYGGPQRQPGCPMPKIDRDGVNLYYEVHGSGPALILTHGYSSTSAMWQGQIDGAVETPQARAVGHARPRPVRLSRRPRAYSEAHDGGRHGGAARRGWRRPAPSSAGFRSAATCRWRSTACIPNVSARC